MDHKPAMERAEGDTAGGRKMGRQEPERHHGGKIHTGPAMERLKSEKGTRNADTTMPKRGKTSAAIAFVAVLAGGAVAANAAGQYSTFQNYLTYFSNAFVSLTGNEFVALDTGLTQGQNPQTENVTIAQMKAYDRPPVAITYAATMAPDYSQSGLETVTLAGNPTINAPTNMYPGATMRLKLTQDATGSRTVTWGAGYKWPAGTAPTLSTTAAYWDIIAFTYDGTNWNGVASIGYH